MRAAAVPFLFLALILLAACGGEPEPQVSAPSGATYSVRGLVRAVPTPGRAQILIYHEAIPEFADADGNVVGMRTMTMPFEPAEGLELEGIVAGDKVRFALEVDWQGSSPAHVTSVEKLPADTELELASG